MRNSTIKLMEELQHSNKPSHFKSVKYSSSLWSLYTLSIYLFSVFSLPSPSSISRSATFSLSLPPTLSPSPHLSLSFPACSPILIHRYHSLAPQDEWRVLRTVQNYFTPANGRHTLLRLGRSSSAIRTRKMTAMILGVITSSGKSAQL